MASYFLFCWARWRFHRLRICKARAKKLPRTCTSWICSPPATNQCLQTPQVTKCHEVYRSKTTSRGHETPGWLAFVVKRVLDATDVPTKTIQKQWMQWKQWTIRMIRANKTRLGCFGCFSACRHDSTCLFWTLPSRVRAQASHNYVAVEHLLFLLHGNI